MDKFSTISNSADRRHDRHEAAARLAQLARDFRKFDRAAVREDMMALLVLLPDFEQIAAMEKQDG